jgi:hypothetical protein
MSWSDVDWCKFCIHVSSLNVPPSPYSKSPSKKIMIKIKLVSMSMIFHCTRLRLSNCKCKGSWGISTKQNVNFKFQLRPMFLFLVSRKSGPIKSCSSSEDLSADRISWSRFDWCEFFMHLRSLDVIFWNCWRYGIKNYGVEVAWHDPPTEFHKYLLIGSKLIGWQTHRQEGDLINLLCSFRLKTNSLVGSADINNDWSGFLDLK